MSKNLKELLAKAAAARAPKIKGTNGSKLNTEEMLPLALGEGGGLAAIISGEYITSTRMTMDSPRLREEYTKDGKLHSNIVGTQLGQGRGGAGMWKDPKKGFIPCYENGVIAVAILQAAGQLEAWAEAHGLPDAGAVIAEIDELASVKRVAPAVYAKAQEALEDLEAAAKPQDPLIAELSDDDAE